MENNISTSDILTETAKRNFGINYLFPYQRLVISNIMESVEYFTTRSSQGNSDAASDYEQDPPSKQIVILPTGAGKSLCFMLPSILLDGPTLVVFPLLSLISDQLRRCNEANIGAAALTGGQTETERRKIFNDIAAGKVKIVLTNPETAISPGILQKLKNCRFSHLVFDEVHTISEWGDTFRPVCLESRRIYIEAEIPVVTAFTATASETVLQRVRDIVFQDEAPHIVSANPDRPNISYTVLPTLCKINSLQLLLGNKHEILEYAPSTLIKRPVLIFCSTRRTAERIALLLRMRLAEDEIFFYHAGLEREEKKAVENWFHSTKNGILAATVAFGMGIDVDSIRTVIHYDLSPSIEAYLQESGRAGRDREPAEAIMLLAPSDQPAESASPRFRALYNVATDNNKCRRESLMKLLGDEPETCFGCDVCRGSVEHTAPWQQAILTLVRRNRRAFTPASAVETLDNANPDLSESDAETMLNELVISGALKRIRFGPWRGKLTCKRLTEVPIKPV